MSEKALLTSFDKLVSIDDVLSDCGIYYELGGGLTSEWLIRCQSPLKQNVIILIQCRRCKKKIRGEPFFVGSPARPFCKSCSSKVTS